MKHITILFIGILIFSFNACKSKTENDIPPSDCDFSAIVSATQYETATSANTSIDTVIITGDCMEITFGASGCDGNTWNINLINDGKIMESFPVQTQLRLSLDNHELCAAYISKTISFDIQSLQLENYTEIILNIDTYGNILYTY